MSFVAEIQKNFPRRLERMQLFPVENNFQTVDIPNAFILNGDGLNDIFIFREVKT
jgi:hypothetical protein